MLITIKKLLIISLFFHLITTVVFAQRYALVIGNSDYKTVLGYLKNPINDAEDISVLLETKGFEVLTLKNATKREIRQGITTFIKQLKQKDSVGLFFFAGHGIAARGRNYIVPIDAVINAEEDIEFESIDIGRVMRGMELAGNNLNMVILDACRNNPFTQPFRTGNQGLLQLDPPRGALILYATSPGDIASDGEGRNGLFTKYLLEAMNLPNYTVESVFKTTANKVYQATNRQQLPWQSGVMLGDFYFSQQIEHYNRKADILFWESIKNETDPAFFTSYLNKNPQGIYANIARLKSQGFKPLKLNNKVRLIIKTSPENASVRILNIVPKYQAGMALKAGRYHIEVSQSGYQRQVEWLTLTNEDVVHSIVLAQNSETVTQSQQGIVFDLETAIPTDEIEFITIQSGCFQMGTSRGGSINEKPMHRVCLTKNYQLGKYEVTQKQWQNVMGSNPSRFKGDHRPVEQVSWHDVQIFIKKLNKNTGASYRLPTEAEWEYAARGGKNAEGINNEGDNFAWYDKNSSAETHRVGEKKANNLGLYDMSGNVWEWVNDWYDYDYYDRSPMNNPQGARGGYTRLYRGGSWDYDAFFARLSNRRNIVPTYNSDNLGFRLVKDK